MSTTDVNMDTRNVSGQSYSLVYDKENRLTSISGGGSNARYGYDGDGRRVIAVENGVITIYIGDSFEAELGVGTTYPVVVPELVQGELPHKVYLPVIRNSVGTGGGAPQVGPGFYLTHPITPNQQSITWRMYYYAEGSPLTRVNAWRCNWRRHAHMAAGRSIISAAPRSRPKKWHAR